MKSKIKFILIIACFVLVSIYFGKYIKGVVVDGENTAIAYYQNFITAIKDTVNKHFRQVDEINSLREQNAELEKSATLLASFASKLNSILEDKNATLYSPEVKLISALHYVNIGDYNKVWVDFKDFNPGKIYGMIYKGKTAGTIVNKDGKAMGLLQTDPGCVFSVYIGDSKIAGVAKGNYKNIIVKYISRWLSPKVGDEVYTSGLDGVFFSGVPVGKVVEVKEEDLYKSAIVEPENKIEVPSYLYVVTKEN